jgi:thiamine biosynthesis lipoprotein
MTSGPSTRAAAALALLLACGAPPAPTPAPTPTPTPTVAPPATPPRDPPPVRKDGTVFAETEQMGTRVTINLWVGDRDPADAGAAIEAAFAEIERIEQIASEWRPTSELSQFNAGAGGPMRPLSPELMELLQRSRTIAEATGGAFDPTFYGVGQLWKFDPGARPPTPEAIAEKLALVGWQGIELDPNTGSGRLARPGMKIGLGAIAKGYAVDRAALVLKQRGFQHHIVEGGGDTYVSGTKGGKSWMVGIQRPDGPGSLAAVPVTDRAIVTSGDYQRYFEHEGKRYSHILDPTTGWPVPEERSARSVTILAADATDADAYATAVAVMGPERGMAFVEAHPALEAVIVPQTGEPMISTDLRPALVWPKPPAAPAK